MRTFAARLVVFGACVALGGCAWWHAVTFVPYPGQATGGGDVEAALIWTPSAGNWNPGTTPSIARLIASIDVDDYEAVRSACDLPKSEPVEPRATRKGFATLSITMGATAVALVGAAAEFLINQIIDAQMRAVEQLEKDANPPAYSVRIIRPASDLARANCLVVMRYSRPEATTSSKSMRLAAIWKIERHGGAAPTSFVLNPVYLRAKDSIAKAAPPKAGDAFPTMNVAMALSLRTVGTPPSTGLPIVHTVGIGESSAQGVPFGCRAGETQCAPAACLSGQGNCKPSDFIPYPPAGSVISLTVSLAEQGDVGIDFDLAKAQLKAVREALGPTAKSAIEARFGD